MFFFFFGPRRSWFDPSIPDPHSGATESVRNMNGRAGARRTKRQQRNPLVKVRVVPWDEDRWGVAGTLDGARTLFSYVMGERQKAEAEAERLKRSARACKPEMMPEPGG